MTIKEYESIRAKKEYQDKIRQAFLDNIDNEHLRLAVDVYYDWHVMYGIVNSSWVRGVVSNWLDFYFWVQEISKSYLPKATLKHFAEHNVVLQTANA